MTGARRFQSGGTLREGSIYVERDADRELPEALLQGDFCHVLAPRQMGKSSLRARVEGRLRERGLRCAGIDLTAIGTIGVTPEQWYFGLIDELARGLGLGDATDFWVAHQRLSPVHRWSRYVRGEVLTRVAEPVVIFVDEIDSVRSLPFSGDDFFASVRALYNARADDASLERIGFCLMGVAAPADLMQDVTKTPFNIGRGVRLEDFTRAEADAFLPGLQGAVDDPRALLGAILAWTEGHPYMTQRVCEVVAQDGVDPGLTEAAYVANVVGELFLRRGRVEDLNLAAAERQIARERSTAKGRQMLELYRRLLDDERVLAMSDDPAQAALRLAGMVAERDDGATVWVRVRNPIFASVFDQSWVRERLKEA